MGRKGRMRGGPRRSGQLTLHSGRAGPAERVMRDEYNLKQGHVMLDRIVVHERSRGRRAGTPAAPGFGRLAFCFASQWVAFNFARSVLAGYLPDTCRSPAISCQEIAGESTAFGGQMIQPVGSAFPLRLAAGAAPPSSSILSNRSRFRP